MKTITELRAESTLNKVFRYPEGTMTRKEWLKMQISKGATTEEKQVRNYAAEEKLEKWLYDNRDMRSGNDNWPPTKEWNTQQAKLKAGIYKTEYRLKEKGINSFWNITKTEFDFVNNTLLSWDIRGEQMDLSNRIGAGIATEEEINADMQKEREFFAKYYSK